MSNANQDHDLFRSFSSAIGLGFLFESNTPNVTNQNSVNTGTTVTNNNNNDTSSSGINPNNPINNPLFTQSLAQGSSLMGNFDNSGKSPWIFNLAGINVFRIAIILLDTTRVDSTKLASMSSALQSDCAQYFSQEFGACASIQIYGSESLTNTNVFDGTRIPIFIGQFGDFLGFHAVQATGAAFNGGYWWKGNSIKNEINVDVPASFPAFTPWGAISTDGIVASIATYNSLNNTYAITDFHQFLSFVLSHEIRETLADDQAQNLTMADNTAPFCAAMSYVELITTNGTTTKVNNSTGVNSLGYQAFPTLNQKFPQGYQLYFLQEAGDAVSWGACMSVNAFQSNGWSLSNYPLPNFWKPWVLDPTKKYDRIGNCKIPCAPFAGLHEFVQLVDLGSNQTYTGSIKNAGPATANQYGGVANIAPNTTWFELDITPTSSTSTSLDISSNTGLIRPNNNNNNNTNLNIVRVQRQGIKLKNQQHPRVRAKLGKKPAIASILTR